MIILVTGGNGQLGQALQAVVQEQGRATAFVFLSSQEMDITDESSISTAIITHSPTVIINAAAYTDVDGAEDNKEAAYAVNATGSELLAKACTAHNIRLIHISTDYVFDGEAKTPYKPDSPPNPQSVYGQSKLAGEQAIRKHCKDHVIIRTSWLYSEFGKNFYTTMLRLGRERDALSVVNDQIGCPTHAKSLAQGLLHVLDTPKAQGTFHYCDDKIMSWYDFAKAIFAEHNITIDLKSIPSSAYPTPAPRPQYSVMDCKTFQETFAS